MSKQLAGLLKSIKRGKIFSVTYVKRDGTIRTIATMNGIRKGVSGEGLKFDRIEKKVWPFYDLHAARRTEDPRRCWRMVNIDTIQSIKFDGIKLQVTQ